MRARSSVVLLLATAVIESGCSRSADDLTITMPSTVVRGSGQFVTEARAVRDFSAISIAAGGRAIITPGDTDSLAIIAEDNILPLIESTVINGTLTLRLTSRSGSLSFAGVTYRIGVRDLRALTASAGSTIEANGIDVANLVVTLSAGSAFIATGTATRFELDASAGSRADAQGLKSREAQTMASSGSTVRLRVTETLVVNASAGSVVEYFGDPAVAAQTSGASIVRRAGP